MHRFVLAELGSDWSLAGSIMTFAIPVALFVVVAAVLYVLYTRPHTVPGHRDLAPATGRHAAGAPRHAAAQPPRASGPPWDQPSGGGYPPAGGTPGAGGYGGGTPGAGGYRGGTPGAGGYRRHDGMEDG